MKMFTRRCSGQVRKWHSEFANSFKTFLMLLLAGSLFSATVYGQAGTAPVVPPTGNMAIDGYLQRQGAVGDWLKGPGGSAAGTYLFNDDGTPAIVAPGLIFHAIDLQNSTSDTVFTGGSKLDQNPNIDWVWTTAKPTGKDDINHALLFITTDPITHHIWVLITGDRKETNGTSFLDIEFYQNTISLNNTPKQGGFAFTSLGPNNGRTVGDLDVTLSYTGGGNVASISFLQWNPSAGAEGGFDYLPLTPDPGDAFVAANDGFSINVPYGAFGSTTYTSLQFIEAAIDVTHLIGGNVVSECTGLPFKSVFMKTKASNVNTAELKDLISPISINPCFDHTAPTFTGSFTTVNLPGCNPSGATITGALGSASATDNCTTPTVTSADGSVQSSGCSRSQTRTFTATDGCGNTATAARTVTWTADQTAPVITTTGDNNPLGCNPSSSAIDGALGTASATDGCSTPTVTSSDGAVQSSGCTRSQTRTWTATDACGNTATASRTATWTEDTTPPSIEASGNSLSLGCNPSTAVIDGALGSASATDACGGTTVTSSDGAIQSDGCLRSQTRTFTATDACGNTATTSRTATWTFDHTPPQIEASGSALNLCNPSSAQIDAALGSASATDECGDVTVTSSDGAVTGDCAKSQTRTFTATDECGNTATTSRTVTWSSDNTPPVISATGDNLNLGCNPSSDAIDGALGTGSATDECGTPTVTSSDGAVQSDGCSRSQTRTFTATDACGNTATTSRTATWTEDVTAPDIEATGTPADGALGCNPTSDAIDAALGSASATDACGDVTVTSSDGAVQSDGCSRAQTRTFTATDACGNTSTTSRTATWTEDTTPPDIVASGTPADGAITDCNPGSDAIDAALGTAGATDACGEATVTASDGPVVTDGCDFSQTRTFTAVDACGNTSSTSRTATWHCCVSTICTYTQGYYGNDGGTSCSGVSDPPNTFTTSELIAHSLENWGGSLTVGCDGNSVTINNNPTDIACVIQVLPGGGKSGALPGGNYGICNLPASLLKNGTINNALLAQTITLGLNLGINPPTLGDFALEPNKWLVTADVVECGSNTIKSCEFSCTGTGPYVWTVTYTPYHVSDCRISQALYDALSTKDVSGLYALANSALCGDALPAGVSYSDITNAEDCINRAFDGCRSFVTWAEGDVAPTAESFCNLPSSDTPCPVLLTQQASGFTTDAASELKVSAYPNPYRSSVQFTIISKVPGHAELEVYNILGQKLATVYNGYLQANRGQVVDYKAPRLGSGLIYKFTVGGRQVTGKLLRIE